MNNKIQELYEKVKDDWCYSLQEGIDCFTESPIEKLLLLGLLSNIPAFDIEYKKDENHRRGYKISFINEFWNIEPQVQITSYIRVDFLIFSKFFPTLRIIIECDGHDFHEKTKEQAKKDKARDRELIKLSFIVLHYTGSEIYNEPDKCYKDIEELFCKEQDKKEVSH